MASAFEALHIEVAALRRRGLLTSEVEIGNLRRALQTASEPEPTGRRDPRPELSADLRARLGALSASSRIVARRLGLSRERYQALLQGRGLPLPPAEARQLSERLDLLTRAGS